MSEIPPRPWRVVADADYEVIDAAGGHVLTVPLAFGYETADLICRLVNAEAQVVEALGRAKATADAISAGVHCRVGGCRHVAVSISKQLDSALALLSLRSRKGEARQAALKGATE